MSRSSQRRSQSIDSQLAECVEFVADQGWTLAAEYTDDGVSATRQANGTVKVRPGFAEFLEAIDRGDADVVVSWELSRLSRDERVALDLRDLCVARGVKVAQVKSGTVLDLEQPSDRERFINGFAAAASEVGTLGQRVQRTLRENAAKGLPHGKPSYGYIYDYDDDGRLIGQHPDPVEAAVIRGMVAEVLADRGLQGIVNDLNRDGVPRGNGNAVAGLTWTTSATRKLLLSHTIVGVRSYKPKGATEPTLMPGKWEPIVDIADWEACRRILTDPARVTTTGSARRHLLTGLASCGVCGSKLRADAPRRGKPHVSYACRSYQRCVAVRADGDGLDRYVGDVIVARFTRRGGNGDDKIAAALISPNWPDPADDNVDPKVAEVQAELAGLRRRKRSLEEALDDPDGSSVAALIKSLARVESKIAAADRFLKRKPPAPAVKKMLDATDPRSVWDVMAVAEQAEVVSSCLTITVNRAVERGIRHFDDRRIAVAWTEDALESLDSAV